MFAGARHRILSWVRIIQLATPRPIAVTAIVKLSSHLHVSLSLTGL